jgi:hypothetical protein
MFIPDLRSRNFSIPDPGYRVKNIPDPGSGSASKNLNILNPKNSKKRSRMLIPDPGSGSA